MITLYQFESCPFCSKVRALLHHIDQPFDIVEVSPFGLKELDFTDHNKVPVLKVGEEIIVESSTIVEYLNEHYAKLPFDDDDKKWADWIDNTLVHYITPLVHPNFNTSRKNLKLILRKENMDALRVNLFSFAGAFAMPKVAKKIVKKYDIKDAKAEYLDAIDHWSNEGLNGQLFNGGDTANLVDCSVFGVLSSCHHLGLVTMAMQQNIAFADWYNRCLSTMSSESKPS